ncbi:MAG: hypothetical protein E7600_07900 [Ruminococcaceae bacterium]|nr:hypothetical protein [Oscillospiraceae bacterium]
MPGSFDFFPDKKIDVSQIRNTRIIAEFNRTRKELPFSLHLIMAIAAAICIYFAADGLTLGLPLLFVVSGMCLGPVLAMYVFCNSPIYLKLATVLIPVAAIGAKALLPGGKNIIGLASCLFMYLLCLLVSAILMKTSLSAYTKTSCFLLISAAYLLITIGFAAFVLIYVKGNISVSIITNAINVFFNSVYDESIKIMSSEDFLKQIRLMLPAASEYTDEKLISLFSDTLKTSIETVKTILPAIVVVTCMVFSFLTVELFTLFAKIFKIDVFVCVMDDFWTYRPSMASTIMYDVVFLAYIIDLFAPLPDNISAAITNLIIIMVASMSVLGVRAIYSFFRKRNVRHFLCALIALGIVSGITFMTGTLGFLLLSTVGVTFVSIRNKHDAMMLPIKLAEDRAAASGVSDDETEKNSDYDNNSDINR